MSHDGFQAGEIFMLFAERDLIQEILKQLSLSHEMTKTKRRDSGELQNDFLQKTFTSLGLLS